MLVSLNGPYESRSRLLTEMTNTALSRALSAGSILVRRGEAGSLGEKRIGSLLIDFSGNRYLHELTGIWLDRLQGSWDRVSNL